MTTIDRDAVWALLRKRGRPLHVVEICTRLGHDKRMKAQMTDVLDRLVEDGLATEMPGNRYRTKKEKKPKKPKQRTASRARSSFVPPPPVKRSGEPVKGRLSMTARGFGFVTAEDGSGDVFIPPPAVGAALHGDRVLIYARPSQKGREGEVGEVLSRRPARLTGRLQRAGKRFVLIPDDPRLRTPMPIHPANEHEIPKAAKRQDNLLVIAEIIQFPQVRDELPEVRIVEVLGVAGMTAVEVLKIKIKEGIVEEFPEEVIVEAENVPTTVSARERRDREDLREIDLVTIDPDNARDHDDALFVTRDGDGFRAIICIADVSHYVREGTAIDAEALERCTSIYLPDRAIPMLPEQISSGIASLVPNRDRLCLGVEVWLGPQGKIRKFRYIEGLMRSKGRLTYEGVARALGLTTTGPRQPAAEKRRDNLEALLELSKLMRKKRQRRGALEFDLPEAKVKLDENEIEPLDVVQSRVDPGVRQAYRMVEEMMLLANEVVAEDLTARGVPTIFRIHGVPDATKVERFTQLAQALGYTLTAEEAQDPKKLARFMTKIEGTEQAPVLGYLLLRAMQQAAYDTTPNIGHFALAAKHYLHFTSPIRRYPDLAVHRVVRKVCREEPMDAATLRPKLRKAAAESSRLSRRAESVERQAVDLYGCILMRDRVGEEFTATVRGVDTGAVWARLESPFVEVMIPLERLGDDAWELDEFGIRVSARYSGFSFAMGDKIEVRIEDVNIEGRDIIALPLDAPEPSEREERPRGRRSRKSSPKEGSRGGRSQGRGAKRGSSTKRGSTKRGSTKRGSAKAAKGDKRTSRGSKDAEGSSRTSRTTRKKRTITRSAASPSKKRGRGKKK